MDCRSAPGLLIAFLIVGLAGCDRTTPLQKMVSGPMVPVQGKVLIAGKPLLGGSVTFYPQAEGADYFPFGVIDAQGNYSVATSGEAGVPVGKYRVTVESGSEDRSQDALVDARYSSAKGSPLTVDVKENAPPGAYDLKLTKLK